MKLPVKSLHLSATDSELCASCSASDVPNILQGTVWRGPLSIHHGSSETSLGTLGEFWKNVHDCAFCRLFLGICVSILPTDEIQNLYRSKVRILIRQVPGRWERGLGLETGDVHSNSAFLYLDTRARQQPQLEEVNNYLRDYSLTCFRNRGDVHPTDRQIRKNFEFFSSDIQGKKPCSEKRLRLVPATEIKFPHVRFDLVKSWLNVCESQHVECSTMEKESNAREMFLYLIDVNTRSITAKSTGTRYIALSYVWGDSQVNRSHNVPRRRCSLSDTTQPRVSSRRLPVSLPQTVEDAILVVRLLGEQYLWVDAYCLDLEDTSERRIAIQAMDTIYEGALLTICGLSGINSDSGLDGISKPQTITPQVSLRTESAMYMATESVQFDHIITESPWNSRAWTFQEGILSRRRLGFHPKGVFLWCQEELFHSMVHIDLSETRDRNLHADFAGSFGALGYDLNSAEWNFRTYVEIVAAYTPRKLSFPSDAENAIRGILNRLSRLTDTPFAFGLPADDLERAILWTEVEDEEVDVCLLRRQGFPSWSWLGWYGKIEYDCWLVDPVLVELPGNSFAYNKHTLKSRGVPIDEELDEIIVPNCANMRLFASGALRIESQIARFKVIKICTTHHLNDPCGECGITSDLTVRSETVQRPEDTGYAWRLVDHHGSEVPIGMCYTKTSGTYLYVESEISRRLAKVRDQTVELVFLQSWYELLRANPDHRERFGDRVWVMVVLRNLDETAERISLTTIPYKSWITADPVPSVIYVV